jgi:hypothetical protein
MKRIIATAFVSILLFSCSNKNERPTTAMDTGRTFIRATLDGDLEKAKTLLLNDTLNIRLFDRYEDYYKNLKPEEKAAYKKANYTINTYTDQSDSVTVINFSNDYMNKPMDIKVVRRDNLWSVDFAYTSTDTTSSKDPSTDMPADTTSSKQISTDTTSLK